MLQIAPHQEGGVSKTTIARDLKEIKNRAEQE
jgi:hypothetical protein